MRMGSLGAHRKRERWQALGGGGAKTGPGKEDAGLDCWRPGYPCWNQPGHPKAFERAAWKAREDGTASILGTVTIRSTSIMADSGQCRSPCSATPCHAHSPHSAISVTPTPLTQLPVTPTPHLATSCHTHFPHTASCRSSWFVTLSAESPPPSLL